MHVAAANDLQPASSRPACLGEALIALVGNTCEIKLKIFSTRSINVCAMPQFAIGVCEQARSTANAYIISLL
jgi:hypothetical protein